MFNIVGFKSISFKLLFCAYFCLEKYAWIKFCFMFTSFLRLSWGLVFLVEQEAAASLREAGQLARSIPEYPGVSQSMRLFLAFQCRRETSVYDLSHFCCELWAMTGDCGKDFAMGRRALSSNQSSPCGTSPTHRNRFHLSACFGCCTTEPSGLV